MRKEKSAPLKQCGLLGMTVCLLILVLWNFSKMRTSMLQLSTSAERLFQSITIYGTSISLGRTTLQISGDSSIRVDIVNEDKALTVHLGLNQVPDYYNLLRLHEEYALFHIGDHIELEIKNYRYKNNSCTVINWQAKSCVTEILEDCIDIGSGHWYGGSELSYQQWPLEKASLPMGPYLAREMLGTHFYGPVQERMFINSHGYGVYIEEDVPLFMSINGTGDKKLCMQAKYDNVWYYSINNTLPILNYTVCTAPNVKIISKLMANKYFKKPTGIPHKDVFRYPIWSTWDKYSRRVNQTSVENFVDDILKHDLPITQVEIDDTWTSKYGDMEFNQQTFPDPKAMVDSMHSRNVSVTLWVHPFINVDSHAFKYLSSMGYLLKQLTSNKPALTSWWDGPAAGYYDFSNPEAAAYFVSQLTLLKQGYGIDSFKFDAGDITFLPPVFKAAKQFMNNNNYARLYAETAFKCDSKNSRLEIRVGARNQALPVMVRILDRRSTWSLNVGLQSIIPSVLLVGIIGYPFVLPDYVGGNTIHFNDPELFVRWIQANALMPFMQLSVEPWQHNQTVLQIAKDMIDLHYQYSNKFISLAEEATVTGDPIIRPLWWTAPTDVDALVINDQFMLGDDVLVAPVVEKAQTIRKIYLPSGKWHDDLKPKVIVGPRWIDYPVTIYDLPRFSKLNN